MIKVTFIGAGSTVFAKNVLGDIMLSDIIEEVDIALLDIDPERLNDSELMLNNLNSNYGNKATINSYLYEDRAKALTGADFIVFAIQVGGYKPSTVIDFEIPKKYGLRQTIGDTLGIGGIFRSLRTIPVILDYAKDIEKYCPDAWVINYVNPMAQITGALLRGSNINAIGLCHSVQSCAKGLCKTLDLPFDELQYHIAGINHQGWLLGVKRHGEDLYPEIRRRNNDPEFRVEVKQKDSVRLEILRQFGYYITESSEHTAEYTPWFIKSTNPELIDRYKIPLDEYPRRCEVQIREWEERRKELVDSDNPLEHKRSNEYASRIIEAMLTGEPYTLGGNVLNKNLITNLPYNCTVEVMCVVNGTGIHPTYIGDLPPQCAALNRTNVNVHELVIEATLQRKKEHVYQAALLDPHTASEMTIDNIVAMVDDLFEAHGDMLPEYR